MDAADLTAGRRGEFLLTSTSLAPLVRAVRVVLRFDTRPVLERFSDIVARAWFCPALPSPAAEAAPPFLGAAGATLLFDPADNETRFELVVPPVRFFA